MDNYLSLFDKSEVDHVCYLVEQTFLSIEYGKDEFISKWLENGILQPLDMYIKNIKKQKNFTTNRNDYIATMDFISACYVLQLDLEDNKVNRFHAETFKEKWLEFIVVVAGSKYYNDLPKEIAKKKKQSIDGKKGGESGKKIKVLPDKIRLEKEINELISNGKSEREANGMICKRYSVTRQALSKAKKRQPKDG